MNRPLEIAFAIVVAVIFFHLAVEKRDLPRKNTAGVLSPVRVQADTSHNPTVVVFWYADSLWRPVAKVRKLRGFTAYAHDRSLSHAEVESIRAFIENTLDSVHVIVHYRYKKTTERR